MDTLQFVYPKVQSELDKKAFRFTVTNAWNNLQTQLQLPALVSLNELKALVKSLWSTLFECKKVLLLCKKVLLLLIFVDVFFFF